jgi:hypothetical protein
MKFNSWEFPVFFLIVWGVYLILKRKPQNIWLLAASYFFYGWWDWRFCTLLAISTLTDYVCAIWIGKTRQNSESGGGSRQGKLRKIPSPFQHCYQPRYPRLFQVFQLLCGLIRAAHRAFRHAARLRYAEVVGSTPTEGFWL